MPPVLQDIDVELPGPQCPRGKLPAMDWHCPCCNEKNWGSRAKCRACPGRKPAPQSQGEAQVSGDCGNGDGSGVAALLPVDIPILPPSGAASRKVQPPAPGRCTFFLVGKGRYCRFRETPGTARCGVHSVDMAEERVPCPLDPCHTVYKSQVAQHVKVCSKRHQEAIYAQQPFFARDINLVSASTQDFSPPERTGEAERAIPPLQASLATRLEEAFPRAVRQVLGEAVDPEKLLECSVVAESGKIPDHAGKHEAQNAALVEVILERSIADSDLVVEYGCGRAGLGAALMAARPGTRCVLVDREGPRHKLDNKKQHRQDLLLRLRLDIADFDLAGLLGQPLDPTSLPRAADFECDALSVSSRAMQDDGGEGGEVSRKFLGPAEQLEQLWRAAAALQAAQPRPPEGVLACAKHLCGGATDIALHSLRRRGTATARVCIATCCHMRCDTRTYVNLPFLRKQGLAASEDDFAQLAALAGCAFGGNENARERRRLGLMAKRMLDIGRLAWCRDFLGLEDTRLINYVGKDVTPENMAIVAGPLQQRGT